MTFVNAGSERAPIRRIAVDIVTVFVSVAVAVALVVAMVGQSAGLGALYGIAAVTAVVHSAVMYLTDSYRMAWRFFSASDAVRCLIPVLAGFAAALAIWSSALPAAGWVIVFGACAIASLAVRCATRFTRSYGLFQTTPGLRNPLGRASTLSTLKQALMIGYGENLEAFLRSMQSRSNTDIDLKITGIVSIAPLSHITSLRGIPVLGSISQMESIIQKLGARNRTPDILVLTRDELEAHSIAEVLSQVDMLDAEIAWLPRTDQLDTGSGMKLRPIKLDDLLSRPPQSFDALACKSLLSGARVLLTGAGGSIGSELVRQIAALSPGEMILTDSSEHALYQIDCEMGMFFPNIPRVSSILDVRDRNAVFRLLQENKPEFVFHAAALKHVPIVEGQPCEGLLTNVVGSQNLADAAVATRAQAMVMISTDKAVNPANVMGATKRLAEIYCQAMDAHMHEQGGETRFVTVRFGNVLGSNGSVVPLFHRQLLDGGPLTVTHPDVERFFMTIPEASRLILQAMLTRMEGKTVDQGIFVLDMGVPVKIVDLARQVIRLSGLRPDLDVKIVYTGLRPGEKLYEELVHEAENLISTTHPSLMIVQPRFVQLKSVQNQLSVISEAARAGNVDKVVRLLKVYIPEFNTTADEAKRIRAKAIEPEYGSSVALPSSLH